MASARFPFFISGRELLYYISFEKEQLILLDLLGQYTNNPNKAIRSEQLLGGYSTQAACYPKENIVTLIMLSFELHSMNS